VLHDLGSLRVDTDCGSVLHILRGQKHLDIVDKLAAFKIKFADPDILIACRSVTVVRPALNRNKVQINLAVIVAEKVTVNDFTVRKKRTAFVNERTKRTIGDSNTDALLRSIDHVIRVTLTDDLRRPETALRRAVLLHGVAARLPVDKVGRGVGNVAVRPVVGRIEVIDTVVIQHERICAVGNRVFEPGIIRVGHCRGRNHAKHAQSCGKQHGRKMLFHVFFPFSVSLYSCSISNCTLEINRQTLFWGKSHIPESFHGFA